MHQKLIAHLIKLRGYNTVYIDIGRKNTQTSKARSQNSKKHLNLNIQQYATQKQQLSLLNIYDNISVARTN